MRIRLIAAETLGDPFRPRDSAVGQDVGVFLFDLLLDPRDTARAHQELDARRIAVLPVAVLVEDADHRFDAVDQALFGQELVEKLRFDGQRAQSAADHDAEAALAIAHHGADAEIVDGSGDAILVAASIERDLEFARQVLREVLAQHRVGQLLRVGAHVEDFVARDAAPDAGGDVADGIEAGFANGESGIVQHVHQVGGARERHEVILHVLARGDVAFAAGELVGDVAELLELARCGEAAGDLHAYHLHAGLALSVDAVFQAEGAEFVVGNIAGDECRSLLAEDLNLLPNGLIVLILKGFALGEVFLDGGGHKHLLPYRD